MKREKIKIENYNKKPLGIFGAKASGKTTFFTTLYGLSGFNKKDESFSVICNDDVSRDYLKKNYKELLKGRLPARTEINDLTEINMSYFYNKSNYHLKSFDFAGEVIKDVLSNSDEMEEDFFEIQNKVYNFFLECSAILIFLEPETDDEKTFERQIEIDKLLGFLKKAEEKWELDIPMALVVTKWDKLSNIKGEYNYEEEEEKAVEYIKKHKVYNNINALISGVAPATKIFPVSAFGDSKGGDLPPQNLKPFNLFSPLIWASQKRDIEWQKKILKLIETKKNHRKIKKIVKIFLKDVSNETLREEVLEKFNKYIFQNRLKRIAAIVFSISLIGGVIGYKEYQENKKQNYYTEIIAEKNINTKLEKIDAFLNIYGKEDRIKKELLRKRVELQNEMIQNLIDTNDKIDLINKFIKKELTTGEINDLLKKKQEINETKKKSNEYTKLMKKIDETKDKYKKYLIVKSFLLENKENENSEKLREKEKVYLRLADRKAYEEIDKMKQNNSQKIFEKIENYLAIDEFKEYRKEIIEIKANLKDEYLFSGLEKAIEYYNKEKTINLIDEVIKKSESYLSNNIFGRKETRVKEVLKQISKIKKGIMSEIEFFVIPKDKKEFKDKKILMSVKVNKKSIQSKKNGYEGKEIYLGNINEKLNFQTKFQIKLYTTDKNGKEKRYVIDNYDYNKINKSKKIITGNGKEIYLEIRTDKSKFEIN